MPAVDVPRRYPLLTAWMEGARPDHPFADALSRPNADDRGQWASFDNVEAVLTALQVAAPGRLDGKRREFRGLGRDEGGLRDLRAELVFAAYLARHGIGFYFGVPSAQQRDLVLPEVNLGVDITTRKTDAVWDLRNYLAVAMKAVSPAVQLRLEFSAHPFAIRSQVRNAIVDQVRAAVAAGETELCCVLRPAADDHPAISLTVTIAPQDGVAFWPRVIVQQPGALLAPSMSDVEDALVVAMEDERKQRRGRAMATMLVVDIAQMSGAWLRSTQQWGERLVGLIQPEHGFAALASMVTSGWAPDLRLIVANSPYAAPAAIDSLHRFEHAFRLRRTRARPSS